MRFIRPGKSFALRRWLVETLGMRRRLGWRARLLIALGLFALAYGARLLHAADLRPLMYTDQQPFAGLTEVYDLRAASILSGEGLLGPYDVEPSNTRWLAHAPGYAIVLAGMYAVGGRDFFGVQLLQNGLTALAPVLLFFIAGRLLGWRVGVAAGLLAALSHHFGHISNFILPDALAVLPVLAGFALLQAARRGRRDWLLYALAGAAFGLTAWLRSQAMLLGVFLAVPLLLMAAHRRRMWPRAALLALCSLLAIAPVTIRNYVVYGAFVPVHLGVGITLWEGIGEAGGERFGAVARDEEVAAQEAELYGDPRYAETWATPDGIRRDRDRTRKSLEIIARHPFWYAGVMFGRMRGMLNYTAHAPLIHRADQAGERPRTEPVRRGWRRQATAGERLDFVDELAWLRAPVRAMQRLMKEPMTLFVLLGAALLFIASWRRALWVAMTPLYYLLFQSFVHTEFRYTLPMQCFVFIFAAVVWVALMVIAARGLRWAWRVKKSSVILKGEPK